MGEKAKPAVASGGHREFSVSDWKAYQKNALRGFLSPTLPSGLVIYNCAFREKDTVPWIGLSARQYTTEKGSRNFQPRRSFEAIRNTSVIDRTTKDARQRFKGAALKAVGQFKGGDWT